MRSISRHWKETRKQLVAVLLAVGLGACQVPGSPRPTVGGPISGPTNAKVETASLQGNGGTAITGRADFPARTSQATPAQVINRATLTLTELSTSTPIVTGQTDTLGNFSLALNGYAPVTNGVYLLEASKGLNNNAAGAEQVRMRTFLKWNGTGWLSMSNSTVGGAILLNTLTTAVALISNLDPTGIDPANTVGKVNGSTLNTSPSFASHSNTEITSLATSLTSYLTNNLDPIAGVSGVLPNVTAISPPNSPPYRTVALMGSGFSPLVGGNTVLFAGSATASVYVATPTALYVVVPAGATSGTVTVKTSLGTSNGVGFSVDTAVGPPVLAAIVPALGAPGDYVTLTGESFSATTTANIVTFQGATGTVTATPLHASATSLVVQVPSNIVSGPVTVTVGGVTTNRFYFGLNVPVVTSLLPTSGNPSTAVTVSGSDFGSLGVTSGIKFNGSADQALVTNWSATQACVNPPAPSLSTRVTGPIRLVSNTGLLSAPFGSFTARTSLAENFATTTQRGPGTTALWGGGSLQMGPSTVIFAQSAGEFRTNTNSSSTGMAASAVGLGLDVPALPHTGGFPSVSYYSQLGVDDSSYFVTTGGSGDAPTVARYALKDGSLLGTNSRSGVTGIIWDRTNHCYISLNSNLAPIIRTYAQWDDLDKLSEGGSPSPFLATNGSYYFQTSRYGVPNIVTPRYVGVMNYGMDAIVASAAGIAGSVTFYLNNANANYLNTYTTNTGVSGTINLPFPVYGPLGGAGYPLLGSDGQFLYELGTNSAYNGGANTLFKFIVNGSMISLLGTPSGTSVTPTITRPSNSVWDAVAVNKTVPTGTSCVIDVLDASTNAVLLSNVANGQSLNSLTASSIKLRATLTGSTSSSPTLASWSVTTRGNYALSNGYDTGTNFATYEAPTITANNSNYTLQYSDSADNVSWGAWVSNVTTLSRRYVRYQIILSASTTQLTGITLPYQY